MDQQLATHAFWFIKALDKRYAMNRGVGWVVPILSTATRISPSSAEKDHNRKNDKNGGNRHDAFLLWERVPVAQPT
jgi:hypothetical protein